MTSRKARQRARAKGGTSGTSAPADSVSEHSEAVEKPSKPTANSQGWALGE